MVIGGNFADGGTVDLMIWGLMIAVNYKDVRNIVEVQQYHIRRFLVVNKNIQPFHLETEIFLLMLLQ